MKTIFRIFISFIVGLSVGCNKEVTPESEVVTPELEVNTSLFNISGEAQTFTVEITCNSEWSVSSSTWIQVSQPEGTGSGLISVSVAENLYENRDGKIDIKSRDLIRTIDVKQNSVFNITTEEVLLRKFYGYSDCYEIYEERIDVTVSPDISNTKYNGMIQDVADEFSKEYNITSINNGRTYLAKGFSLKVNNEPCISNAGIYISQNYMDESDKLSLEYYQSLSRKEFIEIIRNADVIHSMLASWPSSTSTIRLELAVIGDKNVRFYLGNVDYYEIQRWIDYSYLNFDRNGNITGPAVNEYHITKDRFDGRKFVDDEGNVYAINILAKKIEDIHNVDLSLEKEICDYPYSTQEEYPVARITKNNELMYELLVFMYVEFLGTSLNTSDDAYCTGFESALAINGECIRIDLGSGVDDDNRTWFDFSITRLFDYQGGEFQNYEMQNINLHQIEDGRIPLAGVNPNSKQG